MAVTKGGWKIKTGQYQTGSFYYLNRIQVGGYEWNSSRPKTENHDNNDWKGGVYLPSLRNNTVVAGSEKEIKEKIERIVADWFKEALAKVGR